MWVRLLGTAAGGGFPQWNCNCSNCRGLRTGTVAAKPRTQSCVAVSADRKTWFLVNASPDIRQQIESLPALLPPSGVRGSSIAGILLTSADLDHILGLLAIREGHRLVVHSSLSVWKTISEATRFVSILRHYCSTEWREPPAELSELCDQEGRLSGLHYAAFSVPANLPRYAVAREAAEGDAIAYHFRDTRSGGSVVVAPGLARFDASKLPPLGSGDLLLLDGTFWSDDEMRRAGAGAASALDMGHCPISGRHGSLEQLSALSGCRKVYMHINNTNPILVEDSEERRSVEKAGVMVGEDGMEFDI